MSQCTGESDQNHPQEKELQEGKWSSEEALQRAEERKEVKSKGERKRYTQLNTEFQRTARRNKKAFFNEKCKEIKENNRMGKTRDLFRGTLLAKMGRGKDRYGKDLTEAEEIKKRWQEYIEELHKKNFNDWDNDDGVVTHPEPDTMECEVK